VLHFKGVIFIPLASDSGPTLVPLSQSNGYDKKAFSKVYTGPGGVTVNSGGALYFNNNTSSIPTAVLCSSTIDGATSKDVIALRQIVLGGTVNGSGDISGSEEGTALSSFIRTGITAAGVIFISTLRDIEQPISAGTTATGGMPLRMITSNITIGEYPPIYNHVNSVINSSTTSAPGAQNLTAEFRATPYHFSCDAGQPDEIGGFQYNLDGITLFLTH
jgi:hypothetical protein